MRNWDLQSIAWILFIIFPYSFLSFHQRWSLVASSAELDSSTSHHQPSNYRHGVHHNVPHHHTDGKHLFDIRRVFPIATVNKDPKLFEELQSYVNSHHHEVVRKDPDFCNRTFVLATYACPQAIGNHIHEFLNGFIGGFITNRTLIWAFCDRRPCKVDVLADCDAVMTRHSWIMSHWDFMKLWKERNCHWSHIPFELIGMSYRAFTEEFAMCCGIDQLNSIIPVINFGNHELHQFYSLSLPNVRLSFPNARYRSKLLFRNGEDYGYGIILRASFQIKSFIIEKNNELIQQHLKQYYSSSLSLLEQSPPFYISIHLRHATNTNTKDYQDKVGYQCLHDILPKFYHLLKIINDSSTIYHRPCVILFASDRPESIDYWQNWKIINSKVNCTILQTNHNQSHIQWTEHGPYTGEIAVSDIDLLSRGNIMIGSSYLMSKLTNLVSSFSLLIAELRATNGLEYSTNYPSMWLPDCNIAIAASRQPKDLFRNHKLDCKQIVEWPITLHDACPYSNQSFTPLK